MLRFRHAQTVGGEAENGLDRLLPFADLAEAVAPAIGCRRRPFAAAAERRPPRQDRQHRAALHSRSAASLLAAAAVVIRDAVRAAADPRARRRCVRPLFPRRERASGPLRLRQVPASRSAADLRLRGRAPRRGLLDLRPQSALAQAAASLPERPLSLLGLRTTQRGVTRAARGRPHHPPVLASPEMDSEDEQHPAIRGLKTVCRCNNIKYRTIERAIREGAHTLTQVAARTTATMGECGGTCT